MVCSFAFWFGLQWEFILLLAMLWTLTGWLSLRLGAREAERLSIPFPPVTFCSKIKASCDLIDTWVQVGGDLLLVLTNTQENPSIHFVGPGFQKDLGWDPRQLVGKPWRHFIHPEDWAVTKDRVAAAVPGDPVLFTNRWRHYGQVGKDQPRWIWLEWEVTVVQELRLIYAHARNMTNRFEQEAQMATWSRISTDLMAEADSAVPLLERKFGWVNEAWTRNLGWSLQELYGMKILDLLDPSEAPNLTWATFDQDSTNVTIQECAVLCKQMPGGPPRYKNYEWVSITYNGTLYTSGRNIDAEIQHREELQRVISDLEARNADLERFASVTAHQLRSPPRTIAGIAQALQEDYGHLLDEAGIQFLRDIRMDTDQMSEIVDGIYRFSKVRTQADLVQEPVDLQVLMNEVASTLWRVGLCGAQDQLSWTNLPVVLGDKLLLAEALRNLIDNGCKFNESDPKVISVTAALRVDGRWAITVADNGIGIDPQYQHKVFQIFQRMHPSYKGTGVGLALVKAIVQKLGGTITLVSEVGQGTAFTFDLEPAWVEQEK